MKRENEQFEIPIELKERLMCLDKAVTVLAPNVDRRVAEAAKAHFDQRSNRTRMTTRNWAISGALAASLIVAVLNLQIPNEVAPPIHLKIKDDVQPPLSPMVASRVSPMVAYDFDGSGVVDIIDAFTLARMDRLGQVPVSRERIDAIAMSIVALNKESGM